MSPEDARHPGELLPRPDPTVLSTQQVQREIAALRELLEAQLDALDARTTRQQQELDAVPHLIETSRAPLILLMEAKYEHVLSQFASRDHRRQEVRQTDQDALAAALSAARELVAAHNRAAADAVQKSEIAMDKRMDQMMQLLQTTTGALRDMIDDLKARVGLIEGKTSGMTSAQSDQHSDRAATVAMIAVIISAASLALLVIREIIR